MNLAAALAVVEGREDFLVQGPNRISSNDLHHRVRLLAASMAAHGVESGDRVAFQLPPGIDAVTTYRACWHLGAVAVALHPAARSDHLAQALSVAQPNLTVTEPSSALADVAGSVNARDLITEPDPACAVLGDEPVDDSAAAGSLSGKSRIDADAVVLFTSGSTGVPQGVVHTHRSLLYKVAQLGEVHGLSRHDTVLMASPLAHVAGLLHGVLIPGTSDMKTVLMARWDPGTALELIERESVTYMVGPPTMFTSLMDHHRFDPARVRSLRLISCGGTGVTPAFCERAGAAFEAVVKRSYGSTEAPTVATSRFDDPIDKMITTDGRAFAQTRLRVDERGELWVSGPELARGYLDPEATTEAFVNGWFRTGDLATLTDGWVTIEGRLGDRIIRSGENISAVEVERHLEAHPAVRRAVVVAEPDERLGERVAAFVIAAESFDLRLCRAWFARRGAARYLTPERIEVVERLPVLASGKVDRRELTARLSAGK